MRFFASGISGKQEYQAALLSGIDGLVVDPYDLKYVPRDYPGDQSGRISLISVKCLILL